MATFRSPSWRCQPFAGSSRPNLGSVVTSLGVTKMISAASETVDQFSTSTTSPARRTSEVSIDPLRDYLQRIGRARLLTAEEEVELARRIEIGVLAGERLEKATGL